MAQARFTEVTKKAILDSLRKGNYSNVAARMAGIAPSTFYYWQQLGNQARERGEDNEYAEFAIEIDKARAEAEHEAVQQVRDAGKDSWQAAAWWLSRAVPERWAQQDWRNQPPANDDDYKVDLSPPVDEPEADKPEGEPQSPPEEPEAR